MGRDYTAPINLAADLGAYEGYLDLVGRKKRGELEGKYKAAIRAFAFDLLKGGTDGAEAQRVVAAELDEIAAHSAPGWENVYRQVRVDLLARIEADAKRAPWRRALVHRAPLLIAVLVVASYFGVRLYAATPVRDPVQSRAGLEQRAAALDKLLRYNDWASVHVRKGGVLKPILLWPIEPTDTEVQSAQEMAGVIVGGAALLMEQGQACRVPMPSGDAPTPDQIVLLQTVTAHLRGAETRWRAQAMLTILDPIRSAYRC